MVWKTTLDLTDEQKKALQEYKQSLQFSVPNSKILRRALDEYLEREGYPPADIEERRSNPPPGQTEHSEPPDGTPDDSDHDGGDGGGEGSASLNVHGHHEIA